MERRLQKGFQIGFVERILTEVIGDNKEPRDVFSKIAKAIHHRGSSQSKKKDWNAMVRRNTTVRDPIGSSSVADLQQSRQSVKQHIVRNNVTALLPMDAEKLVEYNPKLSKVSPATRVAYAKFKAANLKQKPDNRNNKADENITENSNNTLVSDDMSETKESYDSHPENKTSQTDTTKPASNVMSRKKSEPSCVRASASCSSAVHDELPPGDLSSCTETKPDKTNSPVNDETSMSPTLNTSFSSVRRDFRTRTPIQEEDEENNTEDSKEAEAKSNMDINRETSEPSTTETMSLQKSPMKTGGKSKLSGDVITGWL
jgi:transient receptor potential cation channel subfamily C